MPTAKEYRVWANQCWELADATNQVYAKDALLDLAKELYREARQTERSERARATFHPRTRAGKGRLVA
jgi:hypothetical protein